ncbi:hypothetical protein PG984_008507 [Apiospora sp. TS-2023a]
MTTSKKKDDTSEGSPAPQAAKCQAEPNDPASSYSAIRITRATQDVTMFMGFIASSVAISRYHVHNGPTVSSIALLILLRCLNWVMGEYVVHRHTPIHNHYNLPYTWHDCSVAAILAICMCVLYQKGQIGWAFFAYQATSCYWIGYWLGWWTGIGALLFSGFGCPTGNDTPFTLRRRHVAQARKKVLGNDDGYDIRHTVLGRFALYVAEEFGRTQ